MSTRIAGSVEKTYKNDKGYWSIVVNGTWYSCGKSSPEQFQGQTVSFDANPKEVNGKTYWNVAGDIAATAPAAAPAGNSGGGAVSADARQVSIVRQSSYDKAVRLVCTLVELDKVGLGSKKAASLDIALGLVDSVAAHIADNVLNGEAFTSEEADAEEEDPSLPPTGDFDPVNA